MPLLTHSKTLSESFRAALHRGGLILDAAVGTEIRRLGEPTSLPLWSAGVLRSKPRLLRSIHREHLAAGAHCLTANTFRTQAHVLDKAQQGADCERLTALAVHETRQSLDSPSPASSQPTWILGSMGPLEDCYRPADTPTWTVLNREHRRHAKALSECGIDGFILETFSHPNEIRAAFRAAQSTGLPVILSLVCAPDGRTLHGDHVRSLVRCIETTLGAPDMWALNCLTPKEITAVHRQLRQATDQPTGVWAHVGHEDEIHGWCESGLMSATEYAQEAHQWIADGANLVGGCCGTTAEYLSNLSDYFRSSKLSQMRT